MTPRVIDFSLVLSVGTTYSGSVAWLFLSRRAEADATPSRRLGSGGHRSPGL